MRGNRSSCEVTGSSYPTAKRPRRPAGFGENRAQAASETTPAKADCHVRLRDVRYAVRVLMKAKASTAAAILILALGIGGNIAMFTFLDRLLYAPLPVPKPSQLQLVSCSGFARFPDGDRFKMGCRHDAYVYLRDRNQAFSGLAATGGLWLRERRGKEKIDHPADATSVSGNFFGVLGTRAMIGRALAASDDFPAAPPLAVASYRF